MDPAIIVTGWLMIGTMESEEMGEEIDVTLHTSYLK
jgi:hypothetical protein